MIGDDVWVKAGFIRVFQDVRGKYGSEGDYVMTPPPTGPLNPTGPNDTTDAWDTIDWLVKNVPESNGKRGHDRLVVRGVHRGDGADRSASRAEGGRAGKPHGRRLDGRRLVPLRGLPRRSISTTLPGRPSRAATAATFRG